MYSENRHLFRKGIRWKVGSGTNINFWLDNWCANDSLVSMLGIMDTSLINKSLKVSHFITTAHEWDVTKLNGLVSDPLLQLILATPIPYNDIPILFVEVYQVMVIFLLSQQLGLLMD